MLKRMPMRLLLEELKANGRLLPRAKTGYSEEDLENLRNRLLSKRKLNQETGCWEWTGGNNNGYGKIYFGKTGSFYVHRASFIAFYGQIPSAMCVLHKCDNPRCFNPDHLFLGTVADNNLDKALKGRSNTGERNPFSKLTAEEVLKIRSLYKPGCNMTVELAAQFGISRSNVYSIIRRRHWRHI